MHINVIFIFLSPSAALPPKIEVKFLYKCWLPILVTFPAPSALPARHYSNTSWPIQVPFLLVTIRTPVDPYKCPSCSSLFERQLTHTSALPARHYSNASWPIQVPFLLVTIRTPFDPYKCPSCSSLFERQLTHTSATVPRTVCCKSLNNCKIFPFQTPTIYLPTL